jgi:hypothetical protein
MDEQFLPYPRGETSQFEKLKQRETISNQLPAEIFKPESPGAINLSQTQKMIQDG